MFPARWEAMGGRPGGHWEREGGRQEGRGSVCLPSEKTGAQIGQELAQGHTAIGGRAGPDSQVRSRVILTGQEAGRCSPLPAAPANSLGTPPPSVSFTRETHEVNKEGVTVCTLKTNCVPPAPPFPLLWLACPPELPSCSVGHCPLCPSPGMAPSSPR